MQNHSDTVNDGISLFDIWQTLARRKWWVLGIPLLAVTAAMVAVTSVKPQWEATAVIRIGAVGQVGQVGQVIEPVERVVERMSFRSFGDAVLSDLGYPSDDNPEARLYRGSLTVRALPNTDLVKIAVRGHSRQDAKRAADATVAHVRKTHDQLAASSVQRLRQLLAQSEREMAKTKAEIEKLNLLALKDRPIGQGGFMENVVLANIMVQRDEELRELARTRTLYEERLGPLHTYPTSLMERLSVTEDPVAPKRALVILMAGVLGLALGVVVALFGGARVRSTGRQNKETPTI